jgi:hypothetical protein
VHRALLLTAVTLVSLSISETHCTSCESVSQVSLFTGATESMAGVPVKTMKPANAGATAAASRSATSRRVSTLPGCASVGCRPACSVFGEEFRRVNRRVVAVCSLVSSLAALVFEASPGKPPRWGSGPPRWAAGPAC